MKFLSIIFSAYILCVSTMVCCHGDFLAGDNCYTENHVDGGAREDCAGFCSPFCVCNACPGFSIEITHMLVVTDPQQGCIVSLFSDFSFIPKRSVSAIWQPPRA